jgi:uncharacterized membrane protein
MQFIEKVPRSIAKLITWRVVITFSNGLAVYIATGSFLVSLQVVSIALVINSIVYFLHERAWNRLSWGKKVE